MTSRIFGVGLVAVVSGFAISRGVAVTQQGPIAGQLFQSDSITANRAQLSPNRRWLVLQADNKTSGSSLWLVRASGGVPIRLTSEGFADADPMWTAAGDRVVFQSTRPNRNGGRSNYLMAQPIDTVTGRSSGGPRQIATEAIRAAGRPSPDGRWLSYVTAAAPQKLKIIPANGGTARDIAAVHGNSSWLTFSPDSRHLYFTEVTGRQNAQQFNLKRVSIEGGSPTLVVAADHQIRSFPGDSRYVLHRLTPINDRTRFELRLTDGSGAVPLVLPWGASAPAFTGDGLGVMAIDAEWVSTVQVVSLDGGTPRTLVSGGHHWPEAWMPDASSLITDRSGEDSNVVEAIPVRGGPAIRIVRTPGAEEQGGWHSSIGPWYSYRMRQDETHDEIHGVNVFTGERRRLASSSIRYPIAGRGGFENDANHWIFFARQGAADPTELRRVDPATGSSELLRVFNGPLPFAGSSGVHVHGDRIAYRTSRGDSTDLMLARGNATARRLATFPGTVDVMAWSWDGRRIAIASWSPDAPAKGGLWVVSVPENGGPATQRRYDVPQNGECDAFTWTPDDNYLVMLCYGASGRIMKLRLGDGEFSVVRASEMPQEIWEYYLAPDGKSVAYPIQSDAGSKVYVLDLKSHLKP
jgi:Tol biopolymer transport system component